MSKLVQDDYIIIVAAETRLYFTSSQDALNGVGKPLASKQCTANQTKNKKQNTIKNFRMQNFPNITLNIFPPLSYLNNQVQFNSYYCLSPGERDTISQ